MESWNRNELRGRERENIHIRPKSRETNEKGNQTERNAYFTLDYVLFHSENPKQTGHKYFIYKLMIPQKVHPIFIRF